LFVDLTDALVYSGKYHFPQIRPEMDDYKFIQQRISQQYINQYNATYGKYASFFKISLRSYTLASTSSLIILRMATISSSRKYKIITQVFLYKFLNDKFGYELKNTKSDIAKKLIGDVKWETA